MGTQFAGDVIGVDGDVQDFAIGDRVFGETGLSFGAHAQYVCVAANALIAKIPDGMSYEEAAPLCDGPLTDMNFLRNLADLKPGQHILINGAAGSLGSAAVQLAKGFGAQVTGVCSARNVDFVKLLGADHVIDYAVTDFTAQRNRYEVIYDTVGKSAFAKAKKALTKDGVYISPVLSVRLLGQMLATAFLGSKKAKFSATGMLPIAQQKPLIVDLLNRIAAGQLKMVIDRRYSLDQIADAHAYVDTGHKRGNVVLEMGQA
jgi:NADPH:quinone reductase-like Zn-dependent oxidoreductase